MTWVYKKTEPALWTVGFYDPKGNWEADSDYTSERDAANRVRYLNGGTEEFADFVESVGQSIESVSDSIDRNLTSPNETDRNLENANVVDGLFAIARALNGIAKAIERNTSAKAEGQ